MGRLVCWLSSAGYMGTIAYALRSRWLGRSGPHLVGTSRRGASGSARHGNEQEGAQQGGDSGEDESSLVVVMEVGALHWKHSSSFRQIILC
jgi:hypothetical protein